MKTTHRPTVPAVPHGDLAEIYTRARRERSLAIHGLLARVFHKLVPSVSLRHLGEHWG